MYSHNCVVTAIPAVMPQPLTQIHICAADVGVTTVLLPCSRPFVLAKPNLLRCRRSCLDVAAASLSPLPPNPVSKLRAANVASVSPLTFLSLTLQPNQVFYATVLSQPVMLSCRILCHKSILASLPSLSLPSCCCLTVALSLLPSQIWSAAVIVVLTLLPPLYCHCSQVL